MLRLLKSGVQEHNQSENEFLPLLLRGLGVQILWYYFEVFGAGVVRAAKIILNAN